MGIWQTLNSQTLLFLEAVLNGKVELNFRDNFYMLEMISTSWRMKDLREEVGTKACLIGKIVKSRMKWAGHMVRMKDERY